MQATCTDHATSVLLLYIEYDLIYTFIYDLVYDLIYSFWPSSRFLLKLLAFLDILASSSAASLISREYSISQKVETKVTTSASCGEPK